jgi:hypothetical protein
VWSLMVVMVDEVLKDPNQMATPPDQDPVQALAPNGFLSIALAWALALGAWTGVRITLVTPAEKTGSKGPQNFLSGRE